MQGFQMEAPGEAVAAATQAQGKITQAAIVSDQAEKLKALLIERAARAGISVHESFGGFVIGRGMLREVPDVRALSRCLDAMGACA